MKKIIILALVSVMLFTLTAASFAETINWDDKDWKTYLEEYEDVVVRYVEAYVDRQNNPPQTTLIDTKYQALVEEYSSYSTKRGRYQIILKKTEPESYDEFEAGYERIFRYVQFSTVEWVRYLAEYEAIAISYADELSKEKSDKLEVNVKLEVFKKLLEDYKVKKEIYLPKLEKYNDGRAKEFKSEWKRITNYVAWVEYLYEFEEAVKAYAEELKKEEENPYEGSGINRELILDKFAYENLAASKYHYIFPFERTDPDTAEEYLKKWEEIKSLIPEEHQ